MLPTNMEINIQGDDDEEKIILFSHLDLDYSNSAYLVIVVSKRLYLPTVILVDGWCNFNEWWPPNSKLIQTANGLR